MRQLQLSVAGGRKTQSIVDACAAAPRGRRLLLLTYTLTNQEALRSRLDALGPLSAAVEVQGWLSFLMIHWIQPYLPLRFEKQRLGVAEHRPLFVPEAAARSDDHAHHALLA